VTVDGDRVVSEADDEVVLPLNTFIFFDEPYK
jgi:hypothetical protein